MARRRSWTAAASRGTAVTGGTAAAGDDDQSERDREGNEKLIYVPGLIYEGKLSTRPWLRPVLNWLLGHLVPGATKARY